MSGLFPVSLDDMIEEADREVAMRERVYFRQLGLGTITPDAANRRIAILRAIAARLRDDRERDLATLSARNRPSAP